MITASIVAALIYFFSMSTERATSDPMIFMALCVISDVLMFRNFKK